MNRRSIITDVMAAISMAFLVTGLLWERGFGKVFDALTDTPAFKAHPLAFSLILHLPAWGLYAAAAGTAAPVLFVAVRDTADWLIRGSLLWWRKKRAEYGVAVPEPRYTVLKVTDVTRALNEDEQALLAGLTQKVRAGRHETGEPDLVTVVVEQACPAYPAVRNLLSAHGRGVAS